LRETDMSISDIAARVGYSSSEYLMRVFKKDRGHTPNQFRVQNTEGA
jgi:two-component system response regulator YesN